jgi:hypothetical protein
MRGIPVIAEAYLIEELPDQFHVDMLNSSISELSGQCAEQNFWTKDGVLRSVAVFAALRLEGCYSTLERLGTI